MSGPLTEYLRRFSYAEPRFGLVILGVFAGVGMVLVAIGVYSVIAYTVARQTHEIGIRMALGAERGHVLRDGAAHGLAPRGARPRRRAPGQPGAPPASCPASSGEWPRTIRSRWPR